MDGNLEVEVGEWEFVHNNDDEPIIVTESAVDEEIDSNSSVNIKPDHFSLNPATIPNSISSCSSNSDVDRNFDDSYLANQIFPNHHPNSTSSINLQRWNDSDSDSDATNLPLIDADVAEAVEIGKEDEEKKEEEKEEKEMGRELVWWKVPFEMLKHWVTPFAIPISLPLSVAAAAAFLGLYILGRRLYKMKQRKAQILKLNLALDDKKVSQLMGRVARLNEAFSVVRRIPIVRPSLPAPSITLRPVMSMR